MRLLINSKKRLAILLGGMTLLALAIGTNVFLKNLKELRSETAATFRSRSALIETFIALHRDQVSVMRNLLVANYARDGAGAMPYSLRQYPQQHAWELASTDQILAGTLTGSASQTPSAEQLREIQAATALDAQIRPALAYSKEVTWLYYLSANNFIYLAPKAPISQFHFQPALYQRDYWRDAGPQANPQRRMILEGPYEDMAGKGWILTLAEPVYAADTFLGVVALDLRIDTLQHLTRVGSAISDTMMISEDHQLIASNEAFQPGIRLEPPLNDNLIEWRKDANGDAWLSTPVVKDELWVVHQLKQSDLLWAAARESRPTWVMIALASLLGVLAWRLIGVLSEATRMTHTDPLTQLLNRRGLYERAEGLLALAERKRLPVAVLLMDIDHFKSINDTYGHAVGDSVLSQLGGHLLKVRRAADLICRWGGEEFVIFMLLEHAEDAIQVAERMRQEAQRTRIQPGDVPVTLSGGLALMQLGEPLDQTIKRADLQLYAAKANGRNQIRHTDTDPAYG
jgi:diguanylate cyclase (GGDEF)-like protein